MHQPVLSETAQTTSLLLAHHLEFEAIRTAHGQPWSVSVWRQGCGSAERRDNIATWRGVELFVRAAGFKLYGQAF